MNPREAADLEAAFRKTYAPTMVAMLEKSMTWKTLNCIGVVAVVPLWRAPEPHAPSPFASWRAWRGQKIWALGCMS